MLLKLKFVEYILCTRYIAKVPCMIFFYLILTTTQWGRFHGYSHFYRLGSMISEIRNWARSNKLLGIELLAEHLVVQLLSCVRLLATPWTAACQASLSFTIPWSLLRLMSVESAMPSSNLILCHSLLLLPSVFPSISLFWWVGSLHQMAKILELQHQSFQWIFRIDFF